MAELILLSVVCGVIDYQITSMVVQEVTKLVAVLPVTGVL